MSISVPEEYQYNHLPPAVGTKEPRATDISLHVTISTACLPSWNSFLLMSCFSFGPQLDADSPFSDSLEYIVTWCRLQYVQSCGRQLHPCDPHYSSLPIIYALYPFKGWIFKSQSHFVFILSLQQVQTYFQYM